MIKDFIKKNERYITYGVFVIVVLWLLSLKTCTQNNPYQNQQATIDSLTLANQKYDSILNKKNETIYVQTAIVTSNQATIKNLTDSIFDLKKKNTRKSDKVQSYVATYTDTELEDYLLGFKDTTEFKQFADSVANQCSEIISYMKANTLTVPRTIEDSSKDFKFKGTIDKNGFTINKLSFPDSTYIAFIEHKGGLLKRDILGKRHLFTKKSVSLEIKHTNPLVKVTGLNSIIYKPKVKQRWFERAIIAAGASYLTYKLIK